MCNVSAITSVQISWVPFFHKKKYLWARQCHNFLSRVLVIENCTVKYYLPKTEVEVWTCHVTSVPYADF